MWLSKWLRSKIARSVSVVGIHNPLGISPGVVELHPMVDFHYRNPKYRKGMKVKNIIWFTGLTFDRG